MLLHEMCPGSVAEIELIGPVPYVYDCVYSKGMESKDYSLGMFRSIYTSVPTTGIDLVNVSITNCEDNKVYRFPNSAIVEIKKNIVTVGSVFDIDYKKVRQCKRYKYDSLGILIHDGVSTPIQMIDISGNGVGFRISPVPINVGDTVYVKFISKTNELIFEKVRITRTVVKDDHMIVGCTTIRDLVSVAGII